MGCKDAALTRVAFNIQVPLVTVQCMFNNGQSEAGATTFLRTAWIDPVKPFSQAWDVCCFDADSVIGYLEAAPIARRGPVDRDLAARWRVVDGVIDQIPKDAA